MCREAPRPAEVKAITEDARGNGVCGDDKWKAGWVQKKREEEARFFNGVEVDDGQKGGSTDHEGGPEGDHVQPGGREGRAVE